ncbi:MAG: deoxyhypusine synthase family protein, partial [Candidatus Thorarchaeota archaeon]
MTDFKRDEYLSKKIVPYDLKIVKNSNDFLKVIMNCGFQGGRLGKALEILYQMVIDKECLTILTLSGALVPAGMGKLICALLEHKLVDVIVSTGANITHDFIDAVTDGGHYIGSSEVDDNILYKQRINRIYDVFLPEDNYDMAEMELLRILKKIFASKEFEIMPSDFFKLIGQEISKKCILSIAAKYNIPIFVPAISDSEFALDLIKFTEKENYNIDFRVLNDVKKFAQIVKNAKECGIVIIGGGVPRNWAQQIYPYIENVEQLERKDY